MTSNFHVPDHTDPSGLGMFSKGGRFTSEKYIIFQKKDEILTNSRKFLKVTSLPHLKMDFDGRDHNKSLHDDDDGKPKVVSPNKQKNHLPPFAQQLSREEYYSTKRVRHPAPPCGFYNPRYDYVEKTPRTLFKWTNEKSKDLFRSTMTDFNPEEASRPIPNKSPKKIAGPTLFELQKPREALNKYGNNPHEERFTILDTPKNWSKVPRTINVDMKKKLGRDNKFFKNLEFAPDYEPNSEVGKRQLGSCGPKFDLVSPRKPMIHVSPCTSENFYNANKSEKLKFNRTHDVLFNKYGSRETDPSSPLPSFMQKSINSRIAVGTMRQKTLEINNYSDGKFQTVTSSFFPGKSPQSRLDE